MSLVKNINWSPLEYADAAVVAREAGLEMLNRLELMTIKPKLILDVGCGTGEMSALLQKRYPEAQVLACDLSENMIDHARQTTTSFCVCGDVEKLPLRDQSVDFVFANFMLPWHGDAKLLLREWQRVLRADGLLIFTALGPDTLKEWHDFCRHPHIPQLMDMHDLGDLLLQEKFADPVLDVDYFSTVYRQRERLMQELFATGMWFPDVSVSATDVPMPDENNKWNVTYEVIYGHAFKAAANEFSQADGEVNVSADHLRQLLRGRKS